MIADRVHPRPQLAREQWIDLNGQWEFRFDDARVGLDGTPRAS